MRIQGTVLFVAALAATEASASSIEALRPSAVSPSIVTLGGGAAVDPSMVAAPPLDGPAPSIIALADTPAGDTPSIVTLGGPAPASENMATETPASSERMTGQNPMVIRGGDVGKGSARPAAQPAQATSGTPLLDPNDKGTPAKRKALKRQEERLAREAAAAADQNASSDPSTEPVPLGR